MANPITCEIQGLDEIEEALTGMLVKKARAAMRSALNSVGELMAITISLATNFKGGTGYLARHIIYKVKLSAKEDEGTVNVGPDKSTYWAGWPEFGSIHNKPAPYMRPAFEMNKERWVAFFTSKLREELDL